MKWPDRIFQIWAYSVSIGRLLLRSTKPEGGSKRVDIFFQDTRSLKLPATMTGLQITPASPQLESEIRKGGGDFSGDCTFYELKGHEFSGYVVASVVVVTMDDGEYSDPAPHGPEAW
jgi:hypothetical protein